jgi:hypothetical protein
MNQGLDTAETAEPDPAILQNAMAAEAADRDQGPEACVGDPAESVDEGAVLDEVDARGESAVPQQRRGLKAVCEAIIERGGSIVSRPSSAPHDESETSHQPNGAGALDRTEPELGFDENSPVVRLAEEEALEQNPAKESDAPQNRDASTLLSKLGPLRKPTYAAVGIAALTGVSLIAVLAFSGGSRPDVHAAAAAGGGGQAAPVVLERGVMAPSAKLAMIPPREPVATPLKEPPPRLEKRDQIEEIRSFGRATAKIEGDPSGAQPTGAGKPVGRPVASGPQEVGVVLPQAPAPSDGASNGAEPQPPNDRKLAEGRPPEAATKVAATDAALVPADPPKAEAPTLHQAGSARPTEATVAQANPTVDRQSFKLAVARPGDVSEPAAVTPSTGDAGSRPEWVRGKSEEMQALGLVTTLGTVLADAQKQLLALQVDHDRLRRVVEGRLDDLEHRVTFAEAKRAVDAAQAAGRQPNDLIEIQSAPPTAPPSPAMSSGRPNSAEPKPRIIKAKVEEPLAASRQGSSPRYRVQAASPHLAMLAEIERSGDQKAQIEVAVGDQVTGYGRVTQIVQRGTTWVVVTDRGTIQ